MHLDEISAVKLKWILLREDASLLQWKQSLIFFKCPTKFNNDMSYLHKTDTQNKNIAKINLRQTLWKNMKTQ